MTDFVYNPATGFWELEGYLTQFAGDVPDEISNADAAQHHTLLVSERWLDAARSLLRTWCDDAPVTCPACQRSYTDWNEAVYIGWKGQCLTCAEKKWEAAELPNLFDFEDED